MSVSVHKKSFLEIYSQYIFYIFYFWTVHHWMFPARVLSKHVELQSTRVAGSPGTHTCTRPPPAQVYTWGDCTRVHGRTVLHMRCIEPQRLGMGQNGVSVPDKSARQAERMFVVDKAGVSVSIL